MAARLGSAPAGVPEPRSLPPLLTGAAGRPSSASSPSSSRRRRRLSPLSRHRSRRRRLSPLSRHRSRRRRLSTLSRHRSRRRRLSTLSRHRSRRRFGPSAATAASTATAARPAVGQEPLHRRQMYLTMYVNNDYKLETEKNCHFYQLGCRKIWTSGFHKWAEALCPVTLSSYMFKLCHNGNSAAESAVIYPMWSSAEENVKTLQKREVAYINADSYIEGNYTLRVDCTPLLFQLVYKLTKEWKNQTSFIWRNAIGC
ncbi:uncharacterized protein [Vicugna pacos]|uniref:Uncharacterized protein n=1 Tax=Vicugna pacos TaxID=30538 RepID=A0ABM5CXX0_VICPA